MGNVVVPERMGLGRRDGWAQGGGMCGDWGQGGWMGEIYIWVLASTLDPSVSKINEALSLAYKLRFIL